MVGSLRNTKKKGLKSFIDGLSGWKKGGIIGFLIGFCLALIFLIVDGVSSWEYLVDDPFFGYILPAVLIFILPISLIGMYIGFLVSTKNKYIKKGGIFGGIFGIFITVITFTKLWHNYKWFTIFVINLLKFIGGCDYDCYGIYLILLPVNFLIFTLIGLLLGFIIYKIRRGKNG